MSKISQRKESACYDILNHVPSINKWLKSARVIANKIPVQKLKLQLHDALIELNLKIHADIKKITTVCKFCLKHYPWVAKWHWLCVIFSEKNLQWMRSVYAKNLWQWCLTWPILNHENFTSRNSHMSFMKLS